MKNGIRTLNRIESNLALKFAFVCSPGELFPPGAHRPGRRGSEKRRPMSRVLTGEPLRHEDVHRFSDKLLASIAKQLFDLTVYQDDAALIVHEEDAARRSLRRKTKFLLRSLLLRHIHRNAPQDEIVAVCSSHTAAAVVRPLYTSVRKYNPIL